MIRWIIPILGTAPASLVVPREGLRLLDVRDLVDKEGNSVDAVRKKIEEGLGWLRSGFTVIVGCDYGISRSNAIAAGLLSTYREIPFDEAVRQVVRATGEQEIKLAPLDTVRRALGEGGNKDASCSEPRILLTGGSGFIGTVLRPMLAECWPVFAPSRQQMDLALGNTELDLQVRELRITHLVHLANPRVYTSNHAVGETLVMLRNVLEVCSDHNLHLIYPSGGEIYSGYRGKEITADEKLPPNPQGVKAETQWLCELLIGHHRLKYGLRCGLLRSPVLYGAADRPKFLWTFVAHARAGEPIHTHEYQNGIPGLDLLHVKDFCKAVSSSIRTDFEGDANLGSGRLIPTRQMAILIRDLLGSPSEVLTRFIDGEVPYIAMKSDAASEHLSWKPSVIFEEGLKEMLSNSQKPLHF